MFGKKITEPVYGEGVDVCRKKKRSWIELRGRWVKIIERQIKTMSYETGCRKEEYRRGCMDDEWIWRRKDRKSVV